MLKQQSRLLTKIAVVVDTIMIVAALYAAYIVMGKNTPLGPFSNYDWVLFFMIPVILYLIGHFNLYASLRTRKATEVLADLIKVHLLSTIILSSTIFLLDPRGFSRLLFGGFIVLSLLFITIAKLTIKLILYYLRKHGYNTRHLLLVGCTETAAEFIKMVRRHPEWGFDICGVTDDGPHDDTHFCDVKIIGSLSDVAGYCRNNPIDEVIWCLKHGVDEQEDVYYHMIKMGITFRSILDYSIRQARRTDLTLFHGQFQVLSFYGKEFNSSQLMAKRCLDVVGSCVGLTITLLLTPFIALAIKLDSPGPILFGQMRQGENGRLFKCWKFRSMYIDAEARKQELMANNEMQGAMFKMADDPRVTKVGKFIRKTSIDELLQFWNVLKGEMSLVGTRPPTPDEVKSYKHWHHKRICIKPGITGLWQVSGRNKIKDFDQVVDLDIRYIDEWSLWMDIKIIFKTILVVFARSGAS
jgi:exopolysaccharide biosynthesis polyprenyl glycosylphosphotransferase